MIETQITEFISEEASKLLIKEIEAADTFYISADLITSYANAIGFKIIISKELYEHINSIIPNTGILTFRPQGEDIYLGVQLKNELDKSSFEAKLIYYIEFLLDETEGDSEKGSLYRFISYVKRQNKKLHIEELIDEIYEAEDRLNTLQFYKLLIENENEE